MENKPFEYPTVDVTILASTLQALANCIASGNKEWEEKHGDNIDAILENLPSGSGLDAGMKLILDECSPKKLVFSFGWHHMNEDGYYDGWTDHRLIITPSFSGLDMRITGNNRNGIKEYLYDLFYNTFVV
jgi:hypothetical protein